jgi:DNA-binding MarR family transcriptional regulator
MDPQMTSEAVGSRHDLAVVTAVADNFADLMRSFTKARARLIAAAEQDVEWSAHVVLRAVAAGEGPVRAGTVAEYLRSDPSTVSRQVAALVKDGYLERRSDPADGRASLLVLTAKAEALLADHDRAKVGYFAQLLEGWSEADLRRFAGLLQRFTEAYEATNGNWITERIANRSSRTGSSN